MKMEIASRKLLDDKLVALSLAFQLYKENDRPPKWREQLKKTVADNEVLKNRLNELLHPPAQSKEQKKWKQQETRWERRNIARNKKQQQHRANWLKWLNENTETLRDKKLLNGFFSKGTRSNAPHYLLERMRELGEKINHWTQGNWRDLENEFGIEIATAFRDGLVSSWRSYQPYLRSEKDEDNRTPICIILGLAGLEIESREIDNWPENLSETDAGLACRYAFRELNGFPDWFPKLHKKFRTVVSSYILSEIECELSTAVADQDTHYLLSKVSWTGQWVWDDIAPELLKKLSKEPLNLQNLSYTLRIIQSSSAISDQDIIRIASQKCKRLKSTDHLAYWFSVWIGVEPERAIPALAAFLNEMKDRKVAEELAMNMIVNLMGNNRRGTSARDIFKTPEYLKKLHLLMHEYINVKEDIDRAGKGAYSPGLRDDAQDARNSLFSILKDIPGKQSFLALVNLYKQNPDQPWIMRNAKLRAEQDADITAWSVDNFLEFNESLENTPYNHRELFDLVVQRLLDLKYDLEEGDTSNAQILKDVTEETKIRNFIGGWCRDKARGRYSIAQEDELADKKRPDIRFNGYGFDAPVPTELKLADNWSASTLLERLENQLCGDYLRDDRSNRGVFLLVYRGEQQTWKIPSSNQKANFYDLLEALKNRWKDIFVNYPNIDQIEIIGIDLTKRTR